MTATTLTESTATTSTARVSQVYILAGSATFTIGLPAAGVAGSERSHYTYRVRRIEATNRYPEAFFVDLLVGPDNTDDYAYMGKLDPFTGQVAATAKSAIRFSNSLALRLLNRVLARVWSDDHAAYELHGYTTQHCGHCGRCGRLLTTPDSVSSGFGPECRKIVAANRPKAHGE
jgi:hypothetical protein